MFVFWKETPKIEIKLENYGCEERGSITPYLNTNTNNVISLIIHEENIKEISAMTEVVNVIQNPPDLHKCFVRFSQPK